MLVELLTGRLADAVGVNVETIRYCQCRYPQPLVERVRFVKRAQALGFTLDEIAGLLELDAARACAPTRDLAERKMHLIDTKLADLGAMRQSLAQLMRACDSTGGAGACPIIHALATDS